MAPVSRRNGGGIATHRLVANTTDEYSAALPGFTLDVVRTGAGIGPDIARATFSDDVTLASCVTGFPTLGRTTVADDRVVVGLLTSTPPRSRWCEIDLDPGMMLLYGPGTEHTASDPAGLGYIALSVSLDRLAAAADAAELSVRTPQRGRVDIMPPTNRTVHLAGLLGSARHPQRETNDGPFLARGDAVHALAKAVSDHRIALPGRDRQGSVDSRQIITACIELAEAVGEPPSIAQMCGVAHVSERRLREAFVDTFGVPPSRYFRLRALGKARRRLLARCSDLTVGNAALDAASGTSGDSRATTARCSANSRLRRFEARRHLVRPTSWLVVLSAIPRLVSR